MSCWLSGCRSSSSKRQLLGVGDIVDSADALVVDAEPIRVLYLEGFLREEAARLSKIKVLSIAGLLGRAIESIHMETSVSTLFN